MGNLNKKIQGADDARLQQMYSDWASAENLGGQLGGRFGNYGAAAGNKADKIAAELQARGLDPSALGVNDFSGQFGITEGKAALSPLINMARRAYDKSGEERFGLGALANKKVQGLMADRNREANEAYFDKNIDPGFSQAQSMMEGLAGKNAISAEQEAAMRSRISAQVQSQAATNLKRVGALFGMKGMADSPAAAAYASRMAEDYDSQLVNTLRELGLDVAELNRNATTQDAAGLTQIVTARLAGRNAAIAGDQATMLAIQGQVGELIQAIADRRKVIDLMQKQYEDATDESFVDRATGWINVAQGFKNFLGTMPGMPGAGVPTSGQAPPTVGMGGHAPVANNMGYGNYAGLPGTAAGVPFPL